MHSSHLRPAVVAAVPPRAGRRLAPGWLAMLWSRMAATDPGLLRLQLALRGMLSVGLATAVLVVLAGVLHRAVTDGAFGVVLSMIGPFVMRDPTSRGRQVTLLMLLPPAVLAVVASGALAAHPPAGEAWFLALVFAGALFQAVHPRALGVGLITVVMSYVGLYLRLPVASLPWQVGSLGVGAACVAVVCLMIVPLRPAATLRRAVWAVQQRAGRIVREAGAAPVALRRQLLRLNMAALAAEDQLVLLDEPSQRDVRLHLFDLEQAVARLIALVSAGCVAERHWPRLQVAAERLRLARPHRRAAVGRLDPVQEALGGLIRASAGLQAAAARAMVAIAAPCPPSPAPAGALAWKAAMQVTLASLAAMLGGMALSPQRWFWAVITVYVVFLNARTRGDAIYKGSHRVAGTLVGLFGGLLIAMAIGGSQVAACGIMLAAVFGLYYFYAVSYSVAIFCLTVLLGMIYGLLGTPLEQLLLLRLEETALGVAAAGLAAVFVWPVPTHIQVRRSGEAVLRSLREVVQASMAALAGEGAVGPATEGAVAPGRAPAIEATRRLDRQMADLRLALVPLTAGRFILRRARSDRPVTALLACAEAARVLATAGAVPAGDLPALRGQAAWVEAWIDALLQPGAVPAAPEFAVSGTAGEALRRMGLALAMLRERLAANVLDGFAVD